MTSPRHFLSLRSLPPAEFEELLALSRKMKTHPRSNLLAGRSVGLMFFNRSLRTRATFEIAMFQLGGQSLHLSSSADIWELEPEEGKVMDGPAPEHVKDAARVLSSYLDGIAIRAIPSTGHYERDRADAPLHAFARFSRVPVFNMESFSAHPLQGLADAFTLRETFGDEVRGLPFSLVWTNHPTPQTPSVALSVLGVAARLGLQVRVANPDGYELDHASLEEARAEAARNGGDVRVVYDLAEALEGTRVVYARSWGSRELHGQPTVEAARRAKYASWILNRDALRRTRGAKFMHSMPIRRNVVVTDDVLDAGESLVYLQAENRLHTLTAVLATYLAGVPPAA